MSGPREHILSESSDAPTTPVVKGYNIPDSFEINYQQLLNSYLFSGFQATNLGLAFNQINEMLHFQLSEIDPENPPKMYGFPSYQNKGKTRHCKIFLGCTSNLISSGMRELIKFIVKYHLIDVLVITAGGVEEDLIKCLGTTHLGEFNLKGAELRDKGLNRVGNLIIPNSNYCAFEDWITPIFEEMLKEQIEKKIIWTPSSMIKKLGLAINNQDSVMYWCATNQIPVYSPAITDGSIGDMLTFFSQQKKGLILDIIGDIVNMNSETIWEKQTGVLILGGGLVKHHIMNANLFRDGADFAVYINTSSEYDGSDSGAKPDEAVSWGKISKTAKPVKVTADVTLVLPLIVSHVFVPFIANQ